MGQNFSGNLEMEKVVCRGKKPLKAFKHTCNYFPEYDSCMVIGGKPTNSDIYSFDFKSDLWNTSNDSPFGTQYHSICSYMKSNSQTVLLLWGGMRGGYNFNNDMYEIRMLEGSPFGKWIRINHQGRVSPPNGRWGHTQVFSPETREMIIFAGWNLVGYFSDIWIYHVDLNTWKIINPESEQKPKARWNHEAVVLERQNKMLIFGGCEGTHSKFNDLWEFCFTNKKWKQLNFLNQDQILPRSNFKLFQIHNHFTDQTDETRIFIGPGDYQRNLNVLETDLDLMTAIWEVDLKGGKCRKILIQEHYDRIYKSYCVFQRKNKVYLQGGYFLETKQIEEFRSSSKGGVMKWETMKSTGFGEFICFKIPGSFFVLGDEDEKERVEFLKDFSQDDDTVEKLCICFGEKINVMKILFL